MEAVLIFNHVYWFWEKTTFAKLVAMATKKHLSLIYELGNFADTYCFVSALKFTPVITS